MTLQNKGKPVLSLQVMQIMAS